MFVHTAVINFHFACGMGKLAEKFSLKLLLAFFVFRSAEFKVLSGGVVFLQSRLLDALYKVN